MPPLTFIILRSTFVESRRHDTTNRNEFFGESSTLFILRRLPREKGSLFFSFWFCVSNDTSTHAYVPVHMYICWAYICTGNTAARFDYLVDIWGASINPKDLPTKNSMISELASSFNGVPAIDHSRSRVIYLHLRATNASSMFFFFFYSLFYFFCILFLLFYFHVFFFFLFISCSFFFFFFCYVIILLYLSRHCKEIYWKKRKKNKIISSNERFVNTMAKLYLS